LRATGEVAAALPLLRRARTEPTPSLLFPRRQALAHLAGALLAIDEPQQAAAVLHEAFATRAEDVRSRVISLRVLAQWLARVGDRPAADVALRQAAALAAATDMTSERAATERARAALAT
jgi:hypothetical protein